MFRTKGAREKGFLERLQGGEALEMTQLVSQTVIAE